MAHFGVRPRAMRERTLINLTQFRCLQKTFSWIGQNLY